jgi:hypothetical protein
LMLVERMHEEGGCMKKEGRDENEEERENE